MVDARTRQDVLDAFERVAPAYTDRWTPVPESDDPGWALTELFSEMVTDVVTRLNRVPEKHRVGFYDTLGFARNPPQSGRAPVTVTLSERATENVRIPAGTQMAAPPAGDSPEQVFEFVPGEGFEATPARLHRLYSVDPAIDGIFEHGSALSAGESTQLFGGLDVRKSLQRHALLVGHTDLFDLPGGKQIQLTVETSAPAVLDHLRWEFYEERDDAEVTAGPDANWHPFASSTVSHEVVTAPTVTLVLPTSATDPGFERLTETTVCGVESRWIRGVVEPDVRPETFESLEVESLTVGVGSTDATIDVLLAGGGPVDIPVDGKPTVQPFGLAPQPGDAFYIECAEAFVKHDATITLTLSGMDVVDLPPESVGALDPPPVAWEYWNGKSWALIEQLEGKEIPDGGEPTDSTEVTNLRLTGDSTTGRITFPVPSYLEATTVFGVDGHWIRARLRRGRFHQVTFRKNTTSDFGGGVYWTLVTKSVGVPLFTGITVGYEETGGQAEALVSLNNLDYRLEPTTGGVTPFRRLPDESQTVYLGFDGPLVGGPLHLFVSPEDREYPETFTPRLRWEYDAGSEPAGPGGDGDAWTRAEVRDETADLTRRGLVRLVFSEPSVAHERFDEELHWLRARVTDLDGSFRRADDTTTTVSDAHVASTATSTADASGTAPPTERDCPCLLTPWPCSGEPCDTERRLRTDPPAGRPSTVPPTLRRLVVNTGWGWNVRSVTDETLGDSSGRPNQQFVVDTIPVLEPAVWVDEGDRLSRADREALEAREALEETVDPDGRVEAVWVRWTVVPDFLTSTARDRHVTLEPLTGTLRFGDGVRGAIPPRGVENVRISFRTGGGRGGNVAAGAVTELRSDIRLVDGVANPEAADGGADAESVAQVLTRAPAQLRSRGRAVAPGDVERVALDTSRTLARARCLPRMDEAGERRLGWVTVVIVPHTDDRQPTPSTELRRRVDAAVSERAPATLVAPTDRLFVRGPSYVTVSVAASVVAQATAESVSLVESTAIDAVTSFLHPLTGGPSGAGWAFGEPPCLSDLYALLEGVDHVDHVEDVTLTFRSVSTGDTVTVTDGSSPPTLGPDTLVSSGRHAIGVELTGRVSTAGGRR
ncbi:putative baseplate assembly protein [Halogranum amylolyticum]|uniref:Putative baseplate assembly protein n=1 Tax=Halogranum amylolyticum TaxID=660520 RepID=A0A1H8WG03_9EURY|nr:putative baseplate assembly protein [Halogranum amylolyticum]